MTHQFRTYPTTPPHPPQKPHGHEFDERYSTSFHRFPFTDSRTRRHKSSPALLSAQHLGCDGVLCNAQSFPRRNMQSAGMVYPPPGCGTNATPRLRNICASGSVKSNTTRECCCTLQHAALQSLRHSSLIISRTSIPNGAQYGVQTGFRSIHLTPGIGLSSAVLLDVLFLNFRFPHRTDRFGFFRPPDFDADIFFYGRFLLKFETHWGDHTPVAAGGQGRNRLVLERVQEPADDRQDDGCK